MQNNIKHRKFFKAKYIFLPIIIDVVSKTHYSISLLSNLQFPVPFLVFNMFKVHIYNNYSFFRVFKTAYYYKANILK